MGGATNWPAPYPNLTPLDFLLWGYVKDRVYRNRVCNVRQLNRRISIAIRGVHADVLSAVWKSLDERLNEFVRRNGRHIDHL